MSLAGTAKVTVSQFADPAAVAGISEGKSTTTAKGGCLNTGAVREVISGQPFLCRRGGGMKQVWSRYLPDRRRNSGSLVEQIRVA